MSDNKFEDVKRLDRKSAIIARGMVETFSSGENKLKLCQQGALDWAEEVGVVITGTSLTSKIGRLLRDAGVFEQFTKRPAPGEGYVLEEGPNYEAFIEFLDNDLTYGMRMTGTYEDDVQRFALLGHLNEYGAVRADTGEHRMPSKTYKILRDMLNAGKLDVIYVHPGATVGVKHNGETHRVGYFIEK